MESNIKIELHQAKRLVELILGIEGIVRALEIKEPIRNTVLDNLVEVKVILKEAKLAE